MRLVIHVNQVTAAAGAPWVIADGEGQNLGHASHLVINVPTETLELPLPKKGPRFFVVAEGELSWDGSVATVVPG